MGRSYTLDIDEVGTVLFEKSRRSKNLNIFVRPFRGVRVAIPYGVSFEEAQKAVESRIEWIKKHLERMKVFEEQHRADLTNKIPVDAAYAKKKLTLRVKHLAKEHGFFYNSCSHKNNISLNAKLLRLPEDLADYVILHELMHTRVKSHSSEFWSNLDGVIAGAKKIDSKLRKYHLELM